MPLRLYKCINCGEETERLYITVKELEDMKREYCINCPKCGEFAYSIISKTYFMGRKGKGKLDK